VRKSYDWQKRAVPLFAAVVIILCVFLTAFAIREAERERLLMQKELESELPRIAEQIDDRFKILISQVEDAAFDQISLLDENTYLSQLKDAAAMIHDRSGLIDMVFFLDKTEKIEFPLETPLYEIHEGSSGFKASSFSKVSDPLLTAAEEAEFRQRNYTEARRIYRQLLNKYSDRSVRASLLSYIGRCYLKSDRPIQAVSTYQEILDSYNDQRSPDRTPAGLLALYQICISYSRANMPRQVMDTALKLHEALLEARWRISKEKFQTYLRQTKSIWESISSEIAEDPSGAELFGRWKGIQEKEAELIARTNLMEDIYRHIIPVITEEREGILGSGKFSRFTVKANDRIHFISFSAFRTSSIIGLAYKTEHLIADLLPEAVSAVSSHNPWITSIADSSGHILAGDPIPLNRDLDPDLAFSRPLNPDFPDWKIHVFMLSPSPTDKALIKRRTLYILIALVVTAALVGGGTMAIRSTAKELKLARLKSEFVSTVSHEFRTPLTSIRYLAELLERDRVPEDSLKLKYYRTITQESGRLSRLIENILDFTKIEAGMKKYEFTETDVKELIEEAASGFQNLVAPKKFVVECDITDELPKVCLDREAVQRALFNLLDNAVKYSGKSRIVRILAWADHDSFYIAVEDNGIGIDPGEQKKIFEKFHRSYNNASGHIRGSGIGLTVVTHIVEAHGGNVTLKSEPGKGTTVKIDLPLERPAEKGSQ
jgi:signal transduction histidine kinase